MDYLSEINESLHHLRENNKTLKGRLADSGNQIHELRQQNVDLESHIDDVVDNNSDTDKSTCKRVIAGAKLANKVDILATSDDTTDDIGGSIGSPDQRFESTVCELSLLAVRLQLATFGEIADYLKQEIRVKTGTICLVTCGQYGLYDYQTWVDKNRKYLALKIGDLFIMVNQIHTKFTDYLNNAKQEPIVELTQKSDYVDLLFEERVIELAKEIVMSSQFRNAISIADYLKDELNNRYGKYYGTNWLVTCGFGKLYDLSISLKSGKQRKFLDFLINDFRFTVFQTS
ncbi:uncharacterized protein LOC128954363 [Oppia nitens]|uniref:uncharacterized protein LOC128954363 n=1 Tax=Oppia nitens TaxID=1686743 RepID=UPI0023DB01E9|nr:uncharacterized protein LOC128954363 [Oppia nitens]